jgi:ABC-type multidrug transport system ATPase subunit
MNCIEIERLTFSRARGEPILREVSLQVPLGSIFGLLGPNGAGKTTTLRLLLGLLRPPRGSAIKVTFEKRQIGSCIESPSLYAHLSARENLAIWQTIYRCPRTRIDEALQLVRLEETGRKPAGQFSLGMKQRLGLAIALLHEPQLLILDEPSNGLDPHGMLEMRELLARLNRDNGTTILVSSHLLSEVEKLVTHVAILHRGAVRFQGSPPPNLEKAFFELTAC